MRHYFILADRKSPGDATQASDMDVLERYVVTDIISLHGTCMFQEGVC